MEKTLVVVESPAKAKTIKKYLGPGFEVKASVGHIKDLPMKAERPAKGAPANGGSVLGVEVDNGFLPGTRSSPARKR